ncbi:lysophospholipid acyltransferase family protein [Acidisoma silvae]|uniref:Lauroyl acyltransferase n=1 Tax=Acidisoma silvae TaxID=2802396 RepID=A0A964DYH5_9PROT|nr:lauroyl acyltransferase [Acidisoma silvae]MCB8874743.1 lauroyl acyltransferase [Acidisoma silvae]
MCSVLRSLSPARASNIGGAIARAIGTRLPVVKVADANLRYAMPELDAAERKQVIRGVWENIGRTTGELPHMRALARTASGPGWDISGEEILQAQISKGGPAIFFSGHIGNWEMLPPILAHIGIPMASFYRALANPAVDAAVNGLRHQAAGMALPMFPKGAMGARGAFAHLRQGGYLGMLVDQKMNDGIAVDLFGRPAMTAPALAALALRFRCPVIPGRIRRLGPARLRLEVEAPLALPDSGDRHADIAALMRQVNDVLERWIRDDPGSWLWLHRRWPKQDVRAALA